MHKSESQYRIINEYLAQIIPDPLSYDEVSFEKKEWDNIPMVLPRFIIHMSKHLAALTQHYSIKCGEESTAELRQAMIGEIKQTMQMSTTTQDRLTDDVL